jgi:hypothetical protein
MKALRYLVVAVLFSIASFAATESKAQCAMCTLNAENSVQNGNKQGTGLNKGILALLAAPYLAVAGVGFLWHKKYRRKNVALNLKSEKINLN